MSRDSGKPKAKSSVTGLQEYVAKLVALEDRTNELQSTLEETEKKLEKSERERKKLAVYGELENLISQYNNISTHHHVVLVDRTDEEPGLSITTDFREGSIVFTQEKADEEHKLHVTEIICAPKGSFRDVLDELARFFVNQREPFEQFIELQSKLEEKRSIVEDLYSAIVGKKQVK